VPHRVPARHELLSTAPFPSAEGSAPRWAWTDGVNLLLRPPRQPVGGLYRAADVSGAEWFGARWRFTALTQSRTASRPVGRLPAGWQSGCCCRVAAHSARFQEKAPLCRPVLARCALYCPALWRHHCAASRLVLCLPAWRRKLQAYNNHLYREAAQQFDAGETTPFVDSKTALSSRERRVSVILYFRRPWSRDCPVFTSESLGSQWRQPVNALN